ncbi:hypothetical protein FJY94_03360 [Candidatus Kaiserbacteria bacterium]|nr:hypothetical protein [Candidatus Kaiserbacteria bacterium]
MQDNENPRTRRGQSTAQCRLSEQSHNEYSDSFRDLPQKTVRGAPLPIRLARIAAEEDGAMRGMIVVLEFHHECSP